MIFLMLAMLGQQNPTEYQLFSEPSTTVCTTGIVTSATIGWDAIQSPQTLPLIDGSGTITWTVKEYHLFVSTIPDGYQTARWALPSSTLQLTVPISPPSVACFSITAMGTYPATPSPPLSAPFGLKVLGANVIPTPPSGTWSVLCDSNKVLSSCPKEIDSRGFEWKIPFDTVNSEFLLYVSSIDSDSIYSRDIWGINIRNNIITRRIKQTGNSNNELCSFYKVDKNPTAGHPRGYQWFDTVDKIFYMTATLCVGYNDEVTNKYDSNTRTMLAKIPGWPYWSGASIAYDSGIEYISEYNKAIVCCGDNTQDMWVIEFSRESGTYNNVSLLVKGADGIPCDYDVSYPNPISSHCPVLMYGSGMHTDGKVLWILGGWKGTEASNELYKYDPVNKIVQKIVPVGIIKPPALNLAFPASFFDTKRNRIVVVTEFNKVWQYDVATNMWSDISSRISGDSMVFTSELPYPHRGCNYDQVADAALCFTSYGQGKPPDLRVLTFK